MDNDKTTFVMSGKLYDFAKRLVQVVLPAVSSLYFGLGKIWDFPATEKVVGSLAVIATFIGLLVGVSNRQYESSGLGYDGSVTVTPNDEGTTVGLNVPADKLVSQKAIKLKIQHKPPTVTDNPLPKSNESPARSRRKST